MNARSKRETVEIQLHCTYSLREVVREKLEKSTLLTHLTSFVTLFPFIFFIHQVDWCIVIVVPCYRVAGLTLEEIISQHLLEKGRPTSDSSIAHPNAC